MEIIIIIFLIADASIVNENGESISVNDIDVGRDIFQISGQIGEDDRLIYADSLRRLGKVSEENEKKNIMCKPGLVEVMDYKEIGSHRNLHYSHVVIVGSVMVALTENDFDVYCTKCGDGVCSGVETENNCFADCAKNGSSYSGYAIFGGYNHNSSAGLFYGRTFNDVTRFIKINDTEMITRSGCPESNCLIHEDKRKDRFEEFIASEYFARQVDGEVITMKDGVKAVKIDSVCVGTIRLVLWQVLVFWTSTCVILV